MARIYLSPPDAGVREREYLLRALESNWLAPAGPEIDTFEREVAEVAGRRHAVALSSGTAALHLALLVLGIGPEHDVLVPTFTFVASANVVAYLGGRPVFLDSEPTSWNVDPELVEAELEERARTGRLPGAVMTVDLYGQCADYERIAAACSRHGVPIVEDAAEALGAEHLEGPAGSFGAASAFSFNGNKIVTTSGGGMLLTDDADLAARVRHLATQAREPERHYEHTELGFNYRMSNVLAALGRAQLETLGDRVCRRSAINDRYRSALQDLEGLEFQPLAPWGRPNHWLTCLTIDPELAGTDRDAIIDALDARDIEARPTWKPMHRQPLYAGAQSRMTGVADRIFDTGLCLPSGSSLSAEDQDRVIVAIREVMVGG